MLYPTLTGTQALDCLATLRAEPDVDISDRVTHAGEGEMVIDLSFTSQLEADLMNLTEKFGAQPSDQTGNRFEAEACEIVHRAFPSLPPVVLADPGFWRYLAVFRFRRLVEWRHGSKREEGAHPNNYGVGQSKRNLLYRMYFRADVSLDEKAAPAERYALSRIADKDLWESHILAVRAGNIRPFVRAFLRFLYPKVEGPRSISLLALRELASRLNRLRANMFFELYPDEKSLRSIIVAEAKKAVADAGLKEAARTAEKARQSAGAGTSGAQTQVNPAHV